MITTVYAKNVWTSRGWVQNAAVNMRDGIIESVESADKSRCDTHYLVPGMIEMHAHGSLGYNSARPDTEQNRQWLMRLARHGVTAILPTLSSNPPDAIAKAVGFYADIMKNPVDDGARVVGVHLEGPFLNMEKRGGINPSYIHAPDILHFESIAGKNIDAIKLITLAPELENAGTLIRYLTKKGVCVNAGHSNATSQQMRDAIECGLDGVTHFFNAARPITHRDPGFLTQALITDSVFLEMVSDLVHLAPEIIKLLVKAAGPRRISVVTDAVTLTGMPDGRYDRCVVTDGSPRLENGTLTGGRYLSDGCARALIGIGIDPWDVFCMTSNTPARRLRLKNTGDIAQNYRADLVALDRDFNILYTIINGNTIK